MHPHEGLVNRLVYELWNERNFEVAKEIFAPGFSIQAMYNTITGMEDFEYIYHAFTKAIPDLHYDVSEIVGERNFVCFRWRASGTFKNDFANVQATGEACDHWGISMLEIEGDKIKNIWVVETLWGNLAGS